MDTIAESTTVTTSFNLDEQLLDRARDLAARRGHSTSRLIVDALTAELIADEVAGGKHSNGRPATGGWTQPMIVPKQWNVLMPPLPEWERGTRIAEVRRTFSAYLTRLPSHVELFGLPAECLAPAQRAFDAQLARSLAEREQLNAARYEREAAAMSTSEQDRRDEEFARSRKDAVRAFANQSTDPQKTDFPAGWSASTTGSGRVSRLSFEPPDGPIEYQDAQAVAQAGSDALTRG